MHRRDAPHGSKCLLLPGICLLVSFLLLHTEMASGSPLKFRIWLVNSGTSPQKIFGEEIDWLQYEHKPGN